MLVADNEVQQRSNRAKLTCQGRGAELVFELGIFILAELSRAQRLTLACVLDKDSNRALQQLLSVSNTCSGQVLDFSNTSSRPLSPFRLVSAGSKAPQQC